MGIDSRIGQQQQQQRQIAIDKRRFYDLFAQVALTLTANVLPLSERQTNRKWIFDEAIFWIDLMFHLWESIHQMSFAIRLIKTSFFHLQVCTVQRVDDAILVEWMSYLLPNQKYEMFTSESNGRETR